MGSFNAVCVVSGLPIQAGDRVRFLTLAQTLYGGHGIVCYVGGRWQLQFPPIRAKYNDYGSIEGYDSKDLVTRVFFGLLAHNAVEKGVGDNTVHDVHVRRTMSEEQWLRALQSGRVEITDAPLTPYTGKFKKFLADMAQSEPIPVGIPTLARLEETLKDVRPGVTTGYNTPGFVLDELSRGYIRVRWGAYEEKWVLKRHLERAQKRITSAGYPCVLTAGTGSYPSEYELLVLPAPDANFRGPGMQKTDEHDAQRPVSQAMIREDVWQLLLRIKLQTYVYKKGFVSVTVPELKKAAQEFLARIEKAEAEARTPKDKALNKLLENMMRHDDLFGAHFHQPEGETGLGFKDAFALARKLAKKPTEMDSFLHDLCETMVAQRAYAHLHGQWHPVSTGGQEGNWPSVRNFHRRLGKIRGRWEDAEE